MVDSPPQKNDEQYPLLKVESGGGDSGRPPAQPAAAPGLNVTCSSKRFWFDRWPELFSACWMTGMLLGIFVLIIFGLGSLGVIRKQPIFVLHCNSSGPENEVHFHHIVRRGENVPFSLFSEYISKMAAQYTSLHFSVLFLIDDSMYGLSKPRHSKLLNKLLAYYNPTRKIEIVCDDFNHRQLKDFNVKYQNVNVTIMPLTKFMAMTPLRYKWKSIPSSYLSFYVRVFAVWKNGGIAMDLNTFSNEYSRRQMPDRRINAILKQYNKGTKPEEYKNTLNDIDRDEQNKFFGLFYEIVHQILNETRAFLNRSLSFNQDMNNMMSEPVIRKHRNKRVVPEKMQNASTSPNMNTTIATTLAKLSNSSDITIIESPYRNTDSPPIEDKIKYLNYNTTDEKVISIFDKNNMHSHGDLQRDNTTIKLGDIPNKNGSEVPQFLVLYDFTVFSDNVGPQYLFPEANAIPSNGKEHDVSNAEEHKKASYFLSLTFEGTFIAAMSKQHPFLGHVISAGCHRMPPRVAIQDAIISQCSTILADDVYCSNIYLF